MLVPVDNFTRHDPIRDNDDQTRPVIRGRPDPTRLAAAGNGSGRVYRQIGYACKPLVRMFKATGSLYAQQLVLVVIY